MLALHRTQLKFGPIQVPCVNRDEGFFCFLVCVRCREHNGAWLLVRGWVKRPGKARPNRFSNSTLEFHQTTYQKPHPIILPLQM